MVRIKALKEQIPEGDQRAKEAIVEVLISEGGQFAQGAVRQESDKEDQQLGRSKGRLGGWGFWLKSVFLDDMKYAYTIICIHYVLYSLL